MAKDKTCSGFGAEKKPSLERVSEIRAVTDAALSIAVAHIAGWLASQTASGAIKAGDSSGGFTTEYVLLEAARRLIERKEP